MKKWIMAVLLVCILFVFASTASASVAESNSRMQQRFMQIHSRFTEVLSYANSFKENNNMINHGNGEEANDAVFEVTGNQNGTNEQEIQVNTQQQTDESSNTSSNSFRITIDEQGPHGPFQRILYIIDGYYPDLGEKLKRVIERSYASSTEPNADGVVIEGGEISGEVQADIAVVVVEGDGTQGNAQHEISTVVVETTNK